MTDTGLITSVDALIDALGGTSATARLAGVGPSAVSNWRKTGLPDRASLHSRIRREAAHRGIRVDEALFASPIVPPPVGGHHDHFATNRA